MPSARRAIHVSLVAGIVVGHAARAFARDEPQEPPQQQQQPPPAASPPSPPNEGTAPSPAKKIGLGGDLVFLLPVGAYSSYAGPSIGPVFRGGYRLVPPLDLTLRSGFLLGLTEGSGHVVSGYHLETRVSMVPVWAGARYFFMDPDAGLYGVGELGLNIVLPHEREMRLRFGVNAGLGYVISKTLPIDLRAQLAVLNLFEDIPRDSGSERTYLGIAASAGYTFDL